MTRSATRWICLAIGAAGILTAWWLSQDALAVGAGATAAPAAPVAAPADGAFAAAGGEATIIVDPGAEAADPNKLPDAVKTTVLNEITGQLQGMKGGMPVYTISFSVNGRKYDFKVDASGNVVDKKASTLNVSSNVPLKDTPEPVRAALKELAGNTNINTVEQRYKGDTAFYVAKWVADGERNQATINADGTVTDATIGMNIAEVPEAVRTAVSGLLPNATNVVYILNITTNRDNQMQAAFEVTGEVSGKKQKVRVDATGNVQH